MKTINYKVLVVLLGFFSVLIPEDINAQGKVKKQAFEYHVMASMPVNHLSTGRILGVAVNNDKIISTQIIKGSLPEGISIFDDGTLAVINETAKVRPGKYKIKVEFVDEQGNNFTEKVQFELLNPAHQDIGASVRIDKPKFTNPKLTNHYEAGNIIAMFHDPDGPIKAAELIRGSIPDGVALVHHNKFVITHPEQLKDGEYFCLFFLEDQKGGRTVLAVSLPIGVQVGKRNDNASVSPIQAWK